MFNWITYALATWCFVVAALSGHDVKAMSVTPNTVELEETGHANTAVLKIFNPYDYLLPVELGVRRVSFSETGDTDTLPMSGELTIFPPSAMIPPGATQTVNVVWSGTEPLNKSRTYFISVSQVPVKMPANTNGLRMVTTFQVIANVAPTDALPELSVENIEFVRADQLPRTLRRRRPADQQMALVTVVNTGDRHASLSAGELQLRTAGWSRTFSRDELFMTLGLGLVQPGKRRQFAIPVDNAPAGGNIAASYRFQ